MSPVRGFNDRFPWCHESDKPHQSDGVASGDASWTQRVIEMHAIANQFVPEVKVRGRRSEDIRDFR